MKQVSDFFLFAYSNIFSMQTRFAITRTQGNGLSKVLVVNVTIRLTISCFLLSVNTSRTHSFPGADIGNDHDLVMMNCTIISINQTIPGSICEKYNKNQRYQYISHIYRLQKSL